MRIFKVVLVVCTGVLCLILTACEGDSVSSITKSSPDFPNAVGDEWTYFYYDSLRFVSDTVHVSDTVDVRVTGFGQAPDGGQAKLWVYSYRHLKDSAGAARVDTAYVTEVGDTIRMIRPQQPSPITFVYPFTKGSSWTSGGGKPDTTTIVEVLTAFGIPIGQLRGVLHLERKWTEPAVTAEDSEIWLAPGFGLVAMRLNVVGLMPPAEAITSEVWVMLSYRKAN
ncbi:MAG: hypothetical protein ABIE70_00150 [bacterium]